MNRWCWFNYLINQLLNLAIYAYTFSSSFVAVNIIVERGRELSHVSSPYLSISLPHVIAILYWSRDWFARSPSPKKNVIIAVTAQHYRLHHHHRQPSPNHRRITIPAHHPG